MHPLGPRHFHHLPPTTTRISRRVERAARLVFEVVSVLFATAGLGLACLVIGRASSL